MANHKKGESEHFFSEFKKLTKEEEESKRKAWEAFEKLTLEEKIEHLWKSMYQLQQDLSVHTEPFHEVDIFGLQEDIDKRFRAVYDCLDSLGARHDAFETLALLKSSGPTNLKCHNCGERRVFRKISRSSPKEEYVLECRSCGWREEEKFLTDD